MDVTKVLSEQNAELLYQVSDLKNGDRVRAYYEIDSETWERAGQIIIFQNNKAIEFAASRASIREPDGAVVRNLVRIEVLAPLEPPRDSIIKWGGNVFHRDMQDRIAGNWQMTGCAGWHKWEDICDGAEVLYMSKEQL